MMTDHCSSCKSVFTLKWAGDKFCSKKCWWWENHGKAKQENALWKVAAAAETADSAAASARTEAETNLAGETVVAGARKRPIEGAFGAGAVTQASSGASPLEAAVDWKGVADEQLDEAGLQLLEALEEHLEDVRQYLKNALPGGWGRGMKKRKP